MIHFDANIGTLKKAFAFYAVIVLLFAVVHLTEGILQRVMQNPWVITTFRFGDTGIDAILKTAPNFRFIIFILCLSILSFPLLQGLYGNLRNIKLNRLGRAVLAGVSAAVILGFLAFSVGNDGMGLNYARISERPFEQDSTEYSTRLLMPVIAYILHLRGFWPYYLFFIILTLAFIVLLYDWNASNTRLNFWQFLSLCTSSFVIYQFETPGYPDILVFIFFILVMWGRLDSKAKLSLLILALIAHESSLLVAMVLAWRYLERKDFITYAITAAIYGIVWFIASGFSVDPILATHAVEGRSVISWLLQSPLQEIIGILIAFKALWILLIFGMVLAFRHNPLDDAKFITGCLVAALVMTLLGADTSRLMGYAFPGLLISISTVRSIPNKLNQHIFSVVFLVNLCIPSFNSVLSSGIFLSPGLYEILYQWFGSLI